MCYSLENEEKRKENTAGRWFEFIHLTPLSDVVFTIKDSLTQATVVSDCSVTGAGRGGFVSCKSLWPSDSVDGFFLTVEVVDTLVLVDILVFSTENTLCVAMFISNRVAIAKIAWIESGCRVVLTITIVLEINFRFRSGFRSGFRIAGIRSEGSRRGERSVWWTSELGSILTIVASFTLNLLISSGFRGSERTRIVAFRHSNRLRGARWAVDIDIATFMLSSRRRTFFTVISLLTSISDSIYAIVSSFTQDLYWSCSFGCTERTRIITFRDCDWLRGACWTVDAYTTTFVLSSRDGAFLTVISFFTYISGSIQAIIASLA